MKYYVPSKKSLMWKILKHDLIIIISLFVVLMCALRFFYYVNSKNTIYLSQMSEMQQFTHEVTNMYDNTLNYYYNQTEDYYNGYKSCYENALAIINRLEPQYHNSTYIYRDILAILDTYYENGRIIMDSLSSLGDNKLYYRKDIIALDRLKNYLHQQSYLAIEMLLGESQQYSYATLSTYEKTNVAVYITILFFTFLCIFFAYTFSKHIAKPIHQLSVKFHEAANENLFTNEEPLGNEDEINILTDSYNSMVEKLKQSQNAMLQKTEVELQLQKENLNRIKMENLLKESELKFLQMQINPHFLFNTLNSTCSLAEIEGADATSQMISSLSNLLRHTLATVNEMVTLAAEIDIVENYLFIQKTRFGCRLNYTLDIDEQCMDHKVPAMIIQPLVENAITHGLESLPEGGCVSISAHYLRAKLEIIVEDNGSGMSSDTLRSLQYPVGDRNGDIYEDTQDGAQRDTRRSIGIINVQKRLQMLYGTNPVEIRSRLGEGTCIRILI